LALKVPSCGKCTPSGKSELYSLGEEWRAVELEADETFFVKNKIDSGDIVIRFCQTDKMRSDFFTDALQGTPLRKTS
jgi:hypothetical protein